MAWFSHMFISFHKGMEQPPHPYSETIVSTTPYGENTICRCLITVAVVRGGSREGGGGAGEVAYTPSKKWEEGKKKKRKTESRRKKKHQKTKPPRISGIV